MEMGGIILWSRAAEILRDIIEKDRQDKKGTSTGRQIAEAPHRLARLKDYLPPMLFCILPPSKPHNVWMVSISFKT